MEYNDDSLPYEFKKQSINTEDAYELLLDRANFDIDLLNAQIIINLKIIEIFEYDKEVNKRVTFQLVRQENVNKKSAFASTFFNLDEIKEKFAELMIEVREEEWNLKFDSLRIEIAQLKFEL